MSPPQSKRARHIHRVGIGIGIVAVLMLLAFAHKKRELGHWPWPLNGELINNTSAPVQVWDDDHGPYEVPAHTRSQEGTDVDHVLEPSSGRWCKLGAHKVTVGHDGHIENCPCWSPGAGIDCP